MRIGSLFSGIGGLELGLEWSGLGHTVWQCEADADARYVLGRHWAGVPCYPDVRSIGRRTVEPVDVLCGGFPCQDVSFAGKGAGLDGARSGLWFEFARLIRELRPKVVVVENVAALVGRGLSRVLGDLAESGFDALWFPVRASDVGAPHRRERLFIVAGGGVARWPTATAADGESATQYARGNPSLFGASRAWATPTAEDMNGPGQSAAKQGSPNLRTQVHWATPQNHDAKGPPGSGARERGGRMVDLPSQVLGADVWPTPAASQFNDAENPERTDAHRERTGTGTGMPLAIASKLWPTATARDWKSGRTSDETADRNARPLNEVVLRGPTPTSNDSKDSARRGAGGVLYGETMHQGDTLLDAARSMSGPPAAATGAGGANTSRGIQGALPLLFPEGEPL